MKIRILLILLFLFGTTISNGQTLKENAKVAYLEIIDCYFKKDCAKFYSFFNDSVIFYGKDLSNFISSKKLVDKKVLCTKFDTIIKKTKTKENYLANYSIDVFSFKDFSTMSSKSIDNYFSENEGSKGGFVLSSVNAHKKLYTANDYLVIGDLSAIKKEENYIGARYIFMLRKTSKGWKIIGFLG